MIMDPLVFYLLPVGLVAFASILYLFCRDFKVPNLHNKCVVITGCDTGFGHQLAITLDALGLQVFAGCLTEEGEHKLQTKCSERLQTLRMDVTKSEDIQRCLECVKGFLENVDNTVLWAVVNNAGINISGLVDWQAIQDMKRVFDVNVWGILEVTKAFLPLVKKSRGRIVNVASCYGKVPIKAVGSYCASKYAVQCFSDVLRQELKQFGVSVHIIDPGMHRTNITNFDAVFEKLRKLWTSLDQEKRDEYGEEFLAQLLGGKRIWIFRELFGSRTNIMPVINAMTHAVTSTRPRVRYVIGLDSHFYKWIALLPSGFQDFIFEVIRPLPKYAMASK